MSTDWNHIQLFGWYDREGVAYLIPLEPHGPTIGVVVTGVKEAEMPLLDIRVPSGAGLHLIPIDRNPYQYARELGGFYAVGFYIKEGFERTE